MPSTDQRRARLIEIATVAQQDIDRAPEGSLRFISNHGTTQFYRRRVDGTREYLPKAQNETVRMLAQKDYAQKVAKLVSKELKLLPVPSSDRKPQDGAPSVDCHLDSIAQIYTDLHPTRKPLVNPYVISSDLFAQRWKQDTFKRSTHREEGLIFRTESGDAVRSKSEVIIADKLFKAQVPFKYEQPLQIAGRTVYPDFIVLDILTREEILWEHFGMMDELEYCHRTLQKINAYASAGFVLGKNFIATFESSSVPLRTQTIDAIIRRFFRDNGFDIDA